MWQLMLMTLVQPMDWPISDLPTASMQERIFAVARVSAVLTALVQSM